MYRVLVTARAMLLDLKTIRIVAAIFARNVIALFAIFACHGDLGTDVVTGHVSAFPSNSHAFAQLTLSYWYRGPDLNRRHSDYEPLALPS